MSSFVTDSQKKRLIELTSASLGEQKFSNAVFFVRCEDGVLFPQIVYCDAEGLLDSVLVSSECCDLLVDIWNNLSDKDGIEAWVLEMEIGGAGAASFRLTPSASGEATLDPDRDIHGEDRLAIAARHWPGVAFRHRTEPFDLLGHLGLEKP